MSRHNGSPRRCNARHSSHDIQQWEEGGSICHYVARTQPAAQTPRFVENHGTTVSDLIRPAGQPADREGDPNGREGLS
jgi:hypothetical protein